MAKCEKHRGKKSQGGMGVKKQSQLQPKLSGTACYSEQRRWKEVLALKSPPIKYTNTNALRVKDLLKSSSLSFYTLIFPYRYD